MADKEQVNNAVEEEKPYLWFEYKPTTPVVLSPQPEPVPTPQDNRELIEQQAKQIADLTALVQQLISNK